MALAFEPERERPHARELAFIEHEHERVTAPLADVTATGSIGGVESREPDAVFSGAPCPPADLLHESVHVELERERTARDRELRRRGAIAPWRDHHGRVAREIGGHLR